MILIIYILTPFTMTLSVHLFQGFRIIQTRMMVLAVIHGLRPNQKLKSILEGCTDLTHVWGSTLHAHNLFSTPFFQSQSVYIRFTHIVNMQPKFYIGPTMHHTLDREYSRSRKYLQLTYERLVQAELALRYWREHDNLYIWAPIPIYTERADYRSLEMAIIQEWQPRSLHLPILSPQERHPQETCLEHKRSVWSGHVMASSQTQVHSNTCSSDLDIRTVSKPTGTLDHHPRFRVQHESQI